MHLLRRLGPPAGRGVVVSAVLAAVLLSACSPGRVQIDEPDLSEADRATCEALVDDLPDTLAGEVRRSTDPDDALGAAWGDPAYVLTCGVDEPSDYEPTAECSVIEGVGWYVDEDQLGDLRVDATPVALSLEPYVAVLVPARYRTDGIDGALSELAPVLKKHLGEGLSCL
ncbi:hypothetical protein J2X46_002545 [Nocardioides sp. BE266]|uniref:DUF3515 domain-containing protein n=1 Tax=Nocardioides sp. BE266 TaxID=2817725 RepID=UPI002861D6D0|nr:DUF3515 domain-containing protein [Nocardioides sp. BE266]MDR7253555.1 hypothetical protein [Nocardioides sp. BE266]